MASLQGRHALVTGGGRGIGRAIAAALTAAGATVTVVGRSEDALKETVGKGDASGYAVADVTDAARIGDAVKQAVAARGPVDLLIANAGAAESAAFAKTSPGQFRHMFDLNVMGVVHSAQAVIGPMVARGQGRIVAVASTAGLKGYGYVSAYCTAKHAVIGLVKSLAAETAASGVTVNAVCPGYTDTDMVSAVPAPVLEKIVAKIPVGRLGKADEIARGVLFLIADDAGFITGSTLSINGGQHMY